MKLKQLFSLILFLSASFGYSFAKENLGITEKKHNGLRTSEACAPSSSNVELDINNVRCLLHNGGDMWWDLVGNPRYEVPKVDNAADKRYSSFAGSLWIGGVDEGGQLRVAAQTYRQTGNDFWPGPLTDDGAIVDNTICEKWDKHFKIEKSEIDAFRASFLASAESGAPFSLDDFPAVKNWPTEGENVDGLPVNLAPYVDMNGIPGYQPSDGDYPDIKGDQAIWWVINDKGDVHTETGGEAIGIELHMMAFAFTTANAVNDMTFYQYKVINKSTLTLNQTYIGQWVDADIGNYSDDYVGCDTVLGLGFCYNGDADDETAAGYGLNPPSLGVDFFLGPLADPADGVDNDKDGIVDEYGETIGMSKFVYYENDFSLRGNPEIATHFYGYLRGFWKDGSPMVNNGENGYPGTSPGPTTNYMYPGNGGWCGGDQNGWSEVSANNQPFDRRFLESAGPFTLQPGAVNEIITGVVWSRGYYNDHLGSVCEIKKADQIAQALFDNNFQLLDGPDAPSLKIHEYDQQLVLEWGYDPESRLVVNNYGESYSQADPILVSQGVADSLFEFQGYMIFQLKDNTVSASELFDPNKARLVGQCDINDDVATIVNASYTTVPGIPDPVTVEEVMVQGNNEGIFHSLKVVEDAFAQGTDRKLKNYTDYYFAVVAYAYNNVTSDGKKFVLGNRFFKNTDAVPHKIDFENFGTVIGANYGDGIQLSKTQGIGNGENYVKLVPNTLEEIFSAGSTNMLTYEPGMAPIEVKVVNPKEIVGDDYKVELVKNQFSGIVPDTITYDSISGIAVVDSVFNDWILYHTLGSGWEKVYSAEYTKTYEGGVLVKTQPKPFSGTEHVIPEKGFSISVQDGRPASDTLATDLLISGSMEFDNPNDAWLFGMVDNDNNETRNWISSGTDGTDYNGAFTKGGLMFDPNQNFEQVLNGTWTAFCQAKRYNGLEGNIGPGVQIGTTLSELDYKSIVNLKQLPDVDIVMTSDSTKWSRCVVVETSPTISMGAGSWPMTAKWMPPVDISGNPTSADVTRANQGMGWFPGYAINVSTGQRLNIFFGESTFDKENRGDDMIFNPTSSNGPNGDRAGGRHYVWVSNTEYDGCEVIRETLALGTDKCLSNAGHYFPTDGGRSIEEVYNNISWVGIPMLERGFDYSHPRSFPTDVKIELRTTKEFGDSPEEGDYPVFEFNTGPYAATTGDEEVAKESIMEDILIVPNPYYAISRYERSQLETAVKLTNLPQDCTIKVFTLNGNLVRTYNKNSDETFQKWDLKNSTGVPVASGVYIIHIEARDSEGNTLGEKILKFMCIMPEMDLNAF